MISPQSQFHTRTDRFPTLCSLCSLYLYDPKFGLVPQIADKLAKLDLASSSWAEILDSSGQANAQALMDMVDKQFCVNDKQIEQQTGTELKKTFKDAKDAFGTSKKLPKTVDEMKAILLKFRAEVKLQVATRFQRYVAQVSWRPGSANELLYMVSMVCQEVYTQDLQSMPMKERRAQYAVKCRLESMGASTKVEGQLYAEYPSYKSRYGSKSYNTRSSLRYDLLVTFGAFQVLVEFKVNKPAFTESDRRQLKGYLVALHEDGLTLDHGLLMLFPSQNPMVNDTATWHGGDYPGYSYSGHRKYEVGSFKEHMVDNYRIFKSGSLDKGYTQMSQ